MSLHIEACEPVLDFCLYGYMIPYNVMAAISRPQNLIIE